VEDVENKALGLISCHRDRVIIFFCNHHKQPSSSDTHESVETVFTESEKSVKT
jgi:hypothetical protein